MRRFVDLHTHSICSDGSFEPGELVGLAEHKQLAAVALTDHDTTAGLAEAARRAEQYPLLRFVPGIELSAVFPGGVLHILGLGVNEHSPALMELTATLRKAREERNPKMIAKLRELGVDIDMDDVLGCVAGCSAPDRRVVGRLHMAQALLKMRCVRNLKEAFKKYLGNDAPAFVDKERTPPVQAIDVIHSAGGKAVLAHPPQLRYRNAAQLEQILRQLIAAGMDGIECYHSDYAPQQTRMYLDLAKKFDLLITGGSDFHGPGKPHVHLGQSRVPASMIPERFR